MGTKERDPDTRVDGKPTVLPGEHVGGRVRIEKPLPLIQSSALAGSAGKALPGFRYARWPSFWKSKLPNFTGRLSTTRYWMTFASCCLVEWLAAHGFPAATPNVARMPLLKSPWDSSPSTHALQAATSMLPTVPRGCLDAQQARARDLVW